MPCRADIAQVVGLVRECRNVVAIDKHDSLMASRSRLLAAQDKVAEWYPASTHIGCGWGVWTSVLSWPVRPVTGGQVSHLHAESYDLVGRPVIM